MKGFRTIKEAEGSSHWESFSCLEGEEDLD
jgi:hypothetical protein